MRRRVLIAGLLYPISPASILESAGPRRRLELAETCVREGSLNVRHPMASLDRGLLVRRVSRHARRSGFVATQEDNLIVPSHESNQIRCSSADQIQFFSFCPWQWN